MSTKRRARLEKKRALILKNAKKVLIKKGRNASMADIAESLDMDTSSLYYYFKGVPEIINALLLDEYHDLTTLHNTLRNEGKGSIAILEIMVATILEFYYKNLDIMQIILSQISPLFLSPEYEDLSVAINNYLNSYRFSNKHLLMEIETGISNGEIIDSINSSTILNSLRGAIFGICSSWCENKPKRSIVPVIAKRLVMLYKK